MKQEAAKTMRLSILIAIDPYHPCLANDLLPLLEQSVPMDEVELIVIDWDHGPDFSSLITRFRAQPGAPAVTYLRQHKRSRAAMHNKAMELAQGEILCFLACDFAPNPRFVEAHLSFHQQNPALEAVAFGSGLSPDSLRQAIPFLAWLEDSGLLFGVRFRDPVPEAPPAYFYVANSSGKADFFRSIGAFDERLPYPTQDDSLYQENLVRAGMYSVYLPEAWTTHEHEITLFSRCMQLFQAGWSVALLDGDGGRPFGRLLVMARRRWLRLSSSKRSQQAGPHHPLAPLWRLAFAVFYLAGYLGYTTRLKRA